MSGWFMNPTTMFPDTWFSTSNWKLWLLVVVLIVLSVFLTGGRERIDTETKSTDSYVPSKEKEPQENPYFQQTSGKPNASFVSAPWSEIIPRWVANNEYTPVTKILGAEDSSKEQLLSQFPSVLKFFTYFPYNPTEMLIDQETPWPDLTEFLLNLRTSGRNMFVAPTQTHGKIRNENNIRFIVVEVNVIWESAGTGSNGKISVYGAFGDIGYIDFELSDSNEILDWKFHFLQYPPSFRSFDKIPQKTSEKNFQINGMPTFYLSCDYSDRYIFLYRGWFDVEWFKFWKFFSDAPGTQNGVESFSSMDVTGCWETRVWLESNFKGKSFAFNNNREKCFWEAIGFLNDKIRSISCFNTCDTGVQP